MIYNITSDMVSLTKISKNQIVIKPLNRCSGIELDDDKFEKLYSFYCGLLLEQHS